MDIKIHDNFSALPNRARSQVFEIFPDVHADSRGSFTEVLSTRCAASPAWVFDLTWIRQINRSSSVGKVIRGCHAQVGQYCQAKLVQALTEKIYDVITDARPDSPTFGTTEVVVLCPDKQNQLFVPRGFLHAFVTVSDKNSIFEYFCDNVYCKGAETGVNPITLLPKIAEIYQDAISRSSQSDEFQGFVDAVLHENRAELSPKDLTAPDYSMWMQARRSEYESTGKCWYTEDAM